MSAIHDLRVAINCLLLDAPVEVVTDVKVKSEAVIALIEGLGAEHVFEQRGAQWSLQHPLTCRPNLFACEVQKTFMLGHTYLPGEGRFTITMVADQPLLSFRRIHDS